MNQKQCFKCKATKDIDQFYRHPQMGDGRLGKCKECAKKDVILNRLDKVEYYREYDKRRGNRLTKEYYERYDKENPKKKIARDAVNNAVRDGKLSKPVECEVCGKSGRLHGHHEDYGQPLLVVWVCAACHRAIHHN